MASASMLTFPESTILVDVADAAIRNMARPHDCFGSRQPRAQAALRRPEPRKESEEISRVERIARSWVLTYGSAVPIRSGLEVENLAPDERNEIAWFIDGQIRDLNLADDQLVELLLDALS